MRNYTFAWEIQTLLEQFVAAFNDVTIKRYDNSKNIVGSLSGNKVNYVYAPKQRIYNILKTPAPGGITVPVIAVNITGISRDNNRVFNKNEGFIVTYNPNDNSGNFLKKVLQPVPVNININMTILTKYQSDLDQILTNFIPYCDPYIIISWKLPSVANTAQPYEIRTEVLWNGNVNVQYPIELNPSQSFRITAETGFTIKGWLFKKMDENYNKIYTIQSDYYDGTLTIQDPAKSLINSFEDIFGPIEAYPYDLPPEAEISPILENSILTLDGVLLSTIDGDLLVNI